MEYIKGKPYFCCVKNKIENRFCGAFETINNNLGLIGVSDFDDDMILFILCGANGIINAFAGAEIVEDILNNKYNPLIELFLPKREN